MDSKNYSGQVGLSIAGFDPSSGAGVTADLKVFEAHDIYGMAAITALTVQSTQGVRRTEAVSAELLTDTLDCLGDDVSFAGVKIGMLATGQNVRAVAAWLSGATAGAMASHQSLDLNKVVLDPVLNASSGAVLSGSDAVEAMRTHLLARVGWITPNWRELAILTDLEIRHREDLPKAAVRLQEMARSPEDFAAENLAAERFSAGKSSPGNFSLNVVATGGDEHDPSQPDRQSCDDFLMTSTGEQFWLSGERVPTTSTLGTGCAFSTALACALIAGKDPVAACSAAKAYVTRALQAAYPIGQGRGPMNLAV